MYNGGWGRPGRVGAHTRTWVKARRRAEAVEGSIRESRPVESHHAVVEAVPAGPPGSGHVVAAQAALSPPPPTVGSCTALWNRSPVPPGHCRRIRMRVRLRV